MWWQVWGDILFCHPHFISRKKRKSLWRAEKGSGVGTGQELDREGWAVWQPLGSLQTASGPLLSGGQSVGWHAFPVYFFCSQMSSVCSSNGSFSVFVSDTYLGLFDLMHDFLCLRDDFFFSFLSLYLSLSSLPPCISVYLSIFPLYSEASLTSSSSSLLIFFYFGSHTFLIFTRKFVLWYFYFIDFYFLILKNLLFCFIFNKKTFNAVVKTQTGISDWLSSNLISAPYGQCRMHEFCNISVTVSFPGLEG